MSSLAPVSTCFQVALCAYRRQRRLGAALLLLVMGFSGCSQDTSSTAATHEPKGLDSEVLETARELAVTTLDELCQSSHLLEVQIGQLLQSPTPEHLESARQAWQQAHEDWLIWRLLQRIASHGHQSAASNRIDAYPVLPGYLDQVPGYPASGLVHSEVPLDFDTLIEAHQSIDLYYGVLGFHPLEFMLWGMPDGTGAPSRQPDQFLPRGGENTVPASTRRQLLTSSITSLLRHELSGACAPDNQPPWLVEVGQQLSEDIRRRHTLIWWLQSLTEYLKVWQQYPEGENRNGMPNWHSAFARSDFHDYAAELEWLLRHQWPERGPKQDAAGALKEALLALDKSRLPGKDGGAELAVTSQVAHELLQGFLRPAETKGSDQSHKKSAAGTRDTKP